MGNEIKKAVIRSHGDSSVGIFPAEFIVHGPLGFWEDKLEVEDTRDALADCFSHLCGDTVSVLFDEEQKISDLNEQIFMLGQEADARGERDKNNGLIKICENKIKKLKEIIGKETP